MNRLLLLDGNALIHRAYHALPPLTLASGEPGGAVYGFISMLIRLNLNFQPEYMAVAFDRPGGTFRNQLYEAYQAQRPEAKPELVSQIIKIHEVVKSLGIQSYDAKGFEADDVIGSIAKSLTAKKTGVEQVIIVTGDRDILQLVEDQKIMVYMPVKGLSEAILYGEEDVVKRLGVIPRLIADWKGLCGDPSDNYPGVAGIGPKGAADLVNSFGSIESLYKGIDLGKVKLSPKITDKLLQGRKDAILSKNLATIRTDVPVSVVLKDLKSPDLSSQSSKSIIGALGFSSLVKRAGGDLDVNQKLKSDQDKSKERNKEQMGLF